MVCGVWTTPTANPYVTSPFGMRWHPVDLVWRFHAGTDYRAPTGTRLRAVASGRVVASQWAGVAGNYVRIDHGDGVWSGYHHLSKRLAEVGDRVAAGDVIGYAGATGNVTAAHLHFEISVDGTRVDPAAFLAARIGLTSGGGTTTPTAPDPIDPGTAPAPLTPEEPDIMATIIQRGTSSGTRTLVLEGGVVPGLGTYSVRALELTFPGITARTKVLPTADYDTILAILPDLEQDALVARVAAAADVDEAALAAELVTSLAPQLGDAVGDRVAARVEALLSAAPTDTAPATLTAEEFGAIVRESLVEVLRTVADPVPTPQEPTA